LEIALVQYAAFSLQNEFIPSFNSPYYLLLLNQLSITKEINSFKNAYRIKSGIKLNSGTLISIALNIPA